MQLTGLSDLLRHNSAYQDILTFLRGEDDLSLRVIRAAQPLLLGTLAQDWPGPIIYITARVKRAYNVVEQVPVWLDVAANPAIRRFAEPTNLFYERVAWGEGVIRNRLETLDTLMPMDDRPPTPTVIVTSARALMQRTMPVNQFRKQALVLEPGQYWQMDNLLMKLLHLGYEGVPLVVEPGTFSRRGGVIDIYPMASPRPVRVDFFGDEIDTLRMFEPSSQRSDEKVAQLVVTPAREALPELGAGVAAHLESWFKTLPPAAADMTTPGPDLESLQNSVTFPTIEHYIPYMYANPVSLLDYAPDDALVVVEDWEELHDTVQEIETNAQRARQEQLESGQLPPDYPQPYLDWDTLRDALENHNVLQLDRSPVQEDDATDLANAVDQLFSPGGRFGGQLRPMLTELRGLRNKGGSIVVVTEQAGRLKQLWYEQDSSAFVPTSNDVTEPPNTKTITFVNGTLQEGWTLHTGEQETYLLTDAEIFGWSRPEPRRRKAGAPRKRSPEADYADWKEGDFVVHVDYGIGQFVGMRHRTIDGNDREYLVVEYGGRDTLFVPLHQADRLTKYVGANDTAPTLHRLGQPEWAKTKSRVQKAVEEDATELLELYAARTQATGHAYSPDSHWQHELEAAFPYVETDDQLRAVREVKADMELQSPMDRLICGDVGYGKTEVALRAAFKAVMDGKQVAVLVPTTVLAQQHYETFINRLVQFPVEVEVMSRFRTKEQQSRVLPRVANGEVDILIGTHRILSKDVRFKDLGMIIVDEEQRFGVKHKEHFKKLRTQVDVLTLTATPIPRTLYMSMSGVRDISMIQTPPEERLPVITHVGKFDEKLVRQAILREIERGGQVFVVHNRVKTIEQLRERLEEIVPEARTIIGHGQMHERQLEKVMTAFAHNEYDILLSTSIIESGIDIPNANTLIVDRADMFGMAQLYQIRGRVGRSAQQGYAYFFHQKGLTEEARQRLETLAENTSLGSGFQIAVRDLELRGAGDILSTKQTGQVASVGLHLYTQLLTQAINKIKGQADEDAYASVTSSQGIVIDLPVAAYVPTDWIEEMALRLQIYRRIAGLTKQEHVEAMRKELRDRFGLLPEAVEGLLFQIEVKIMAQLANATHVMARDGQMQIKLPFLGEVNREALAQQLGEDVPVQVSRTAVTFPMDMDTVIADDDDESNERNGSNEERKSNIQSDPIPIWRLHLLDILQMLADGIKRQTETEGGIGV